MIPQRAEILPRSATSAEATSIGKGILLPLDQTGSHFLGIKDLSKPLNGITGEIRDQWSYMTHLTAARYPFESLLSPFGRGGVIGGRDGYGAFDFSLISGARRKNATRETTSPLKAWLHEHRKNPYPTKGEKIMLAILTKMTLTQISTWFANARRRLKKDNKMTWSPRNKSSDKRESLSKASNSQSDDMGKSVSSNEDDDVCMETDENDQRLLERSKLDVYSNDDDVFSEDGRSDSEKVETGEKADLPSLPPSGKLSQENLLKKIDFAGNNSPVGNLQRWVDGHFGNQSPIDFPRELTPPRTPVEDIVSPGLQPSKENHKDKENTCHSKQEPERKKKSQVIAINNHQEPTNNVRCQSNERTNQRVTLSNQATRVSSSNQTTRVPSLPLEEIDMSLAPNEFGLQTQFRSCGLTSHKEIDAVLALTSLASR